MKKKKVGENAKLEEAKIGLWLKFSTSIREWSCRVASCRFSIAWRVDKAVGCNKDKCEQGIMTSGFLAIVNSCSIKNRIMMSGSYVYAKAVKKYRRKLKLKNANKVVILKQIGKNAKTQTAC